MTERIRLALRYWERTRWPPNWRVSPWRLDATRSAKWRLRLLNWLGVVVGLAPAIGHGIRTRPGWSRQYCRRWLWGEQWHQRPAYDWSDMARYFSVISVDESMKCSKPELIYPLVMLDDGEAENCFSRRSGARVFPCKQQYDEDPVGSSRCLRTSVLVFGCR